MKRLQQIWRRWLERYFFDFVPTTQTPVIPTTDADVLRYSIKRYFQYNQSDLLYILPYEPMYETSIDGIRQDGWQVVLHVSKGGDLFYSISAKRNASMTRF